MECFLWGIGILELEEIEFNYSDDILFEISNYISKNLDSYTEIDYGFNKEVIARYSITADFFEEKFDIDTSIYISPNVQKRQQIKELSKPNDTSSKLSEFENLGPPSPDE